MPPSYPDTALGRRLAVIDNPHIVDWYFGHRVNALMKSFFDGVLGSVWRWSRFEYQGRGRIYLHGTVKLKNDPGLVELMATAYEGVCAGVVYTQRRNEVLGILVDVGPVELPKGIVAELQQLKEVISTGRAAEDTICRYADWLMSTTNTRTSAEREAGPGGISDSHPSSVNPLREGPFNNEFSATDDFDGVVNCVERHKRRPEGYCKRKVCAGAGVPAAFKCRFEYSFAECGQTRLEFNELDNGGVKATLVTRRNGGNMSSHNRVVLQNWRVNIDIQLLLDWEDAVRYMVKDVYKQESGASRYLTSSNPRYAETTTTTPSVQKPDFAKFSKGRGGARHYCAGDKPSPSGR